jgi:hypothetical protein
MKISINLKQKTNGQFRYVIKSNTKRIKFNTNTPLMLPELAEIINFRFKQGYVDFISKNQAII